MVGGAAIWLSTVKSFLDSSGCIYFRAVEGSFYKCKYVHENSLFIFLYEIYPDFMQAKVTASGFKVPMKLFNESQKTYVVVRCTHKQTLDKPGKTLPFGEPSLNHYFEMISS